MEDPYGKAAMVDDILNEIVENNSISPNTAYEWLTFIRVLETSINLLKIAASQQLDKRGSK